MRFLLMRHTALYLSLVATIAALVGQHIVRRLIILFGRASLIVFILAGTIFISAVSLGKHVHFLDQGCVQSHLDCLIVRLRLDCSDFELSYLVL